jgi:deoxyribodipyrimidine photolyase-related protein
MQSRLDCAPAEVLRLVLGDQLNPRHSWFTTPDPGVLYLLMEVRQETDYVLHHAQKIIAIFAAMRAFAAGLRRAGHRVAYFTIDDPANLHAIPANVELLLGHCGATVFEYQEPDEYRLDEQLHHWRAALRTPSRMVGSEHFYTSRH